MFFHKKIKNEYIFINTILKTHYMAHSYRPQLVDLLKTNLGALLYAPNGAHYKNIF